MTSTMTLQLCTSYFLVNIEVSIVGTSLISITNDLHNFKQGEWVVTGYLITYTIKIFNGDVTSFADNPKQVRSSSGRRSAISSAENKQH